MSKMVVGMKINPAMTPHRIDCGLRKTMPKPFSASGGRWRGSARGGRNAYSNPLSRMPRAPIAAQNVLHGTPAAIKGPMNVLAGPGTPPVPELAKLGVKRVTVGSNITKATLLTIKHAAEELMGAGSYEFARGAPGQPEVHRILAKPGG